MKALIKKIKFYCKFLFRLNYYKGIDKLTFTDWLYKSRLNFKDVKELYEIIVELNERGIDYDIETMDDVYDANNGDCNVAIDDMVYVFSDGELIDVAIVEM